MLQHSSRHRDISTIDLTLCAKSLKVLPIQGSIAAHRMLRETRAYAG
jgi:hypothetical protein